MLGNHDWWLDAARVEKALQSAGIPILDDRTMSLRAGEHQFWLVGFSDFWQRRFDIKATLDQVAGNAPAIALTHNPDLFPAIPSRVCLTLAGHTHGGQVALPIVGRPVVPSRYGQNYAAGPHRKVADTCS